jgi:hypothetical protein
MNGSVSSVNAKKVLVLVVSLYDQFGLHSSGNFLFSKPPLLMLFLLGFVGNLRPHCHSSCRIEVVDDRVEQCQRQCPVPCERVGEALYVPPNDHSFVPLPQFSARVIREPGTVFGIGSLARADTISFYLLQSSLFADGSRCFVLGTKISSVDLVIIHVVAMTVSFNSTLSLKVFIQVGNMAQLQQTWW